jgi:hypothetical protein
MQDIEHVRAQASPLPHCGGSSPCHGAFRGAQTSPLAGLCLGHPSSNAAHLEPVSRGRVEEDVVHGSAAMLNDDRSGPSPSALVRAAPSSPGRPPRSPSSPASLESPAYRLHASQKRRATVQQGGAHVSPESSQGSAGGHRRTPLMPRLALTPLQLSGNRPPFSPGAARSPRSPSHMKQLQTSCTAATTKALHTLSHDLNRDRRMHHEMPSWQGSQKACAAHLSVHNLQAPSATAPSEKKRCYAAVTSPSCAVVTTSPVQKKRLYSENVPTENAAAPLALDRADSCAISSNGSAVKRRAELESPVASPACQIASPVSREADKQRRALQIFEAELQQRLTRRQRNVLAPFSSNILQPQAASYRGPSGRPLSRSGSRCFGSHPKLDSSTLEQLAACMKTQ